MDRGDFFYSEGKYVEAILAYDEAIRRDPEYARAWNNKAAALAALGRYDEAIRAYDEALRLDPGSVKVWYNRASALEALGRAEEAEVAYARARELTLKREAPSCPAGQR